MIDFLGPADLAKQATRAHVLSARPDAPVIPDREPWQWRRRARAAVASLLRQLAGGLASVAAWLEPRPRAGACAPEGAAGGAR